MSATRKPHWSRVLVAMGACDPAVQWARKRPTARDAWRTCPDGEWLRWVCGRFGYYEAIAPARRAYDEACATARRAYYEACAPARRAYDEACAPARRDLADAIRSAVPWRLIGQAWRCQIKKVTP